jgi:2-hydroxy-3-keto-5-methylthiopentenyl-1-phosphate phosphatase
MKTLGFEQKNAVLLGDDGTISVNEQRQILKDHILMGKQKKLIDNFQAVNNSQMREGLGRLNDSQFDQLVVSRIVNYPELIFNQRIKNDNKKQYRFF